MSSGGIQSGPERFGSVITVIGSSNASADELTAAALVGRLLADHSRVLFTGGRGGVMEAAARAHRGAGGFSVGFLPGTNTREANSYNSLNIPAGVGFARNLGNVLAGTGVVVVGGGPGTLSELGYALQFKRPLCMLAYLPGASALPPETLRQIAPEADPVRIEDPEILESEIVRWLDILQGKIQAARPEMRKFET